MLTPAGLMRHRVTVQTPTTVNDETAGYTQTWATLTGAFRLPAHIRPAIERDLERTVANTTQATASHLVTIPYVAGVTTQARLLVYDGATTRVLQINGVHDDEERHRQLTLTCAETVS